MLPGALPSSLVAARSRERRVNSDPSCEPNVPLMRESDPATDYSPRVDASSDRELLTPPALVSRCRTVSSAVSCCSTAVALPKAVWTLPWRVRLLWLISALATVDHFIFPPHGLLPLRSLTGWADHSPPLVCGWDYEASWKIGLARGKGPTSLVFSHASSQLNPLFTCSQVPSPPVSFVADPFLLIVDRANRPLAQPLHPNQPATARSQQPYRAYLFYEMKNLDNMLGEIGVALSKPAPAANDSLSSFTHLGTALSEPFHLSYPLPLYDSRSGSFLLIPEVHQTLSVRIYSASAASFPFGWQLHSVPLRGRHFVDTSPVFYRGLWYVFTTVHASLLLYTTPDLLEPSAWSPHPLSPLTSYNWRTSRSAGRPIIHDGRVIRFAQDDSSFYGMAVYAIELEELSPTTYREARVGTVRPHTMSAQGRQWASQRLHHMDVKRTADGDWLAVVDGDEHIPNHEFWAREGWWRTAKDLLTLCLLVVSAHLTLLHWKRQRPLSRLAHSLSTSPVAALRSSYRSLASYASSSTHAVRQSLPSVTLRTVGRVLGVSLISLLIVVYVIDPLFSIRCGESNGYELHGEMVSELHKYESSLSLPLPPDVSARFNLSDFPSSAASVNSSALLDSLSAFSYPDSAASYAIPALPAHPPLPSLSSSSSSSLPQPFVPFPGFVVVTAASSSYFDRLHNFVGSIHFWEPSQRLVVYDLGLTPQQTAAIGCWHNVELRPFQFHLYPQHVRNLYNYAWKPLMLEQAFALPHVSAVLLLDSGTELRAPHAFSDIKRSLMERGYWFARQTYNVEQRTMPETLTRLGIDVETVRGQPFCAGGLHGFMKGSPAYQEVAMAAFECAKDEACIAPPGSGRATHNFDQSVMSALVYATGRRCDSRRGYREESMSAATADEANFNADVVLLLRRWHQPKPYVRHVRAVQSAACPFIHSTRRAMIDYPPSAAIDAIAANLSSPTTRALMETLLIQHKDGSHLQADSPLVLCLHRHNNSRYACRRELMEHQRAVVEVVAVECKTLTAWLDFNVVPVHRLLRCGNTWLLALYLFALVWYTPALLRQALATWLRVAVLAAALSCLLVHPVLVKLLDTYGTSSPVAVSWYTELRSPPSDPFSSAVSPTSLSDSAARPPFPIVFSLSLKPHQLASINQTLSSLAAQSLRPDAVHVNLPSAYSTSHHPPSYLVDGSWDGVAVHVHRGDANGPLSQTALTLQAVSDPAALIIAVEADTVYPSTLLSLLVQHAQLDSRTAFSLCGWAFLFRPAPVGVTPIHVPWSMRGQHGRAVDVLQAECGVAYRRGWFPAAGSRDFDELSAPHPHCQDEEDVWLSGWLTTRANVSKAVVAGWPGSSEALDRKHTQVAPGLDMMCIRAVEQTIGPWRQLRTV